MVAVISRSIRQRLARPNIWPYAREVQPLLDYYPALPWAVEV